MSKVNRTGWISIWVVFIGGGLTMLALEKNQLLAGCVILLFFLAFQYLMYRFIKIKDAAPSHTTTNVPLSGTVPITPMSINSVLLQREPTHIVLDLGLRPDVQTPASLKARVLLNPYMAKLLMLGLMQTVEEHEQEHGVIKTPSRDDIRARAEHAKLLNALGDINLN